MNEQFVLLSQDYENATLHIEDTKAMGIPVGSYIPILKYFLNIPYKNYQLEITNELGNENMGYIKVDLKHHFIPDFKITSGNHFINLFLRKKQLLSVSCAHASYKNKLYKLLISSKMEKIAQENSFEPVINTQKEKNNVTIKTRYSLQMDDKMGALKALIEFHKSLIDTL